MKKYILALLLSGLSAVVFAQAKMVISDDAFLVIKDSTSLVIANPAADALQTSGTGGNIVSEGESNRLIWNVGDATGTYTVPFTTVPVVNGGDGAKIPLSIDITTAGDAGGSLALSTYKTDNYNMPYPSVVSNMFASALSGDGALMTIDRFWIMNAESYTTRPAATISIGYDDGPDETGGSNAFSEVALKAQRWDPSASDHWGGVQLGTVDFSSNKVNGINVTPTDFFMAWTLVSTVAPLPVTLTSFNGDCKNDQLVFEWITASEHNNNFFELQRSTDGQSWETIATINGAGNSMSQQHYSYAAPENSSAYYRLALNDFSANKTYSQVIHAGCADKAGNISVVNSQGNAGIYFLQSAGTYQLELITMDGKLLERKTIIVPSENYFYLLEKGNYASGVYLLRVYSDQKQVAKKVMLSSE